MSLPSVYNTKLLNSTSLVIYGAFITIYVSLFFYNLLLNDSHVSIEL